MSQPKTVLVHVNARLAAALIRFKLARKSGMYGRKKEKVLSAALVAKIAELTTRAEKD